MSHGNHIIPVGQTDYYVHPIAVISDWSQTSIHYHTVRHSNLVHIKK
jgi:hypothetical protein